MAETPFVGEGDALHTGMKMGGDGQGSRESMPAPTPEMIWQRQDKNKTIALELHCT